MEEEEEEDLTVVNRAYEPNKVIGNGYDIPAEVKVRRDERGERLIR